MIVKSEISCTFQKDAEISSLKTELAESRSRIQSLEDEKKFLEGSIKVGQVQKEMLYDETDKIQNVQQQEIIKLKSMLLFREQVIRLLFCLIRFQQETVTWGCWKTTHALKSKKAFKGWFSAPQRLSNYMKVFNARDNCLNRF